MTPHRMAKVWQHARGINIIRTPWFQVRVTLWTRLR